MSNSAFSTNEDVETGGSYRKSLFMSRMKIGEEKETSNSEHNRDDENQNIEESNQSIKQQNDNKKRKSSTSKKESDKTNNDYTQQQDDEYDENEFDQDYDDEYEDEYEDDDERQSETLAEPEESDTEDLQQQQDNENQITVEEKQISPFPLPLFPDIYCRSDDIAFGISELDTQPQPESESIPEYKPEPDIRQSSPEYPVYNTDTVNRRKPQEIPDLMKNPEVEVDEIQYEAEQLKAERFANMSKREQRKYLKRKKKEERKRQKQEQKEQRKQKRKKQKGEKKYIVKKEYQSSGEEENYYSDVKPQDEGKVDTKSSSPLSIFTKNWKLGIVFIIPFIFGLVMLITGIGSMVG